MRRLRTGKVRHCAQDHVTKKGMVSGVSFSPLLHSIVKSCVFWLLSKSPICLLLASLITLSLIEIVGMMAFLAFPPIGG